MATPLVLASSEIVTNTSTLGSAGLTIEALHIVSPSVPVPTLTDGRPQ